jgi:uncharacterized membrane protein
MNKKDRAFELDAMRGLAVIGMIFYHFIFDVRHMMGVNVFAFQDEIYFNDLIRPTMTLTFVVVSGISSCFSRSNAKRALKILLVSIIFSTAMAVASQILKMDLYVFFNVLHLLTVSTAGYALFQFFERKYLARRTLSDSETKAHQGRTITFFIVLAALILFFDRLTTLYYGQVNGYWLLPLGFLPKDTISMGDYLPIIPWLGFFLIGLVIGRVAYPDKKSLFPSASEGIRKLISPVAFLGRHSLIVYLLHQPVFLASLFGLRYLGVL